MSNSSIYRNVIYRFLSEFEFEFVSNSPFEIRQKKPLYTCSLLKNCSKMFAMVKVYTWNMSHGITSVFMLILDVPQRLAWRHCSDETETLSLKKHLQYKWLQIHIALIKSFAMQCKSQWIPYIEVPYTYKHRRMKKSFFGNYS